MANEIQRKKPSKTGVNKMESKYERGTARPKADYLKSNNINKSIKRLIKRKKGDTNNIRNEKGDMTTYLHILKITDFKVAQSIGAWC